MKVHIALRRNIYCNIQESTGISMKGFEGPNKLKNFKNIFTGAEASTVACLVSPTTWANGKLCRVDYARSPSSWEWRIEPGDQVVYPTISGSDGAKILTKVWVVTGSNVV